VAHYTNATESKEWKRRKIITTKNPDSLEPAFYLHAMHERSHIKYGCGLAPSGFTASSMTIIHFVNVYSRTITIYIFSTYCRSFPTKHQQDQLYSC
jgi:hypothetical protein